MIPGTIARRLYVGTPAETLWEWLVDPDRVYEYSLTALEARPSAPGDPIRYMSKLGGHAVIEGIVEELVEGRRLVHTFQYQFEPLEAPSRVTWELLRYGDRMCCLDLRHEGLDPEGEAYRSALVAWDVLLSSLKTCVETGRPLPWPGRGRGCRV